MTNNRQEQIDRLQAELDKLKAEIEGDKPWPQEGDECFVLLSDGGAIKVSHKNDGFHINPFNQGNIFRTEAEAIKERDRREVEQKLRVIAKGYEFIGGYDYSYFLLKYRGSWMIDFATYRQKQGTIYFKSLEDAYQALALGEAELDKLL
jgi:hypothetical protein